MTPERTQSPIRYPSDLIDEEWEILQPVFDELEPYTTGRPQTTDLRETLNGKAARQLITDLFLFLHTITKIWADSGYSGLELSDWLWHPIRMPDRGR